MTRSLWKGPFSDIRESSLPFFGVQTPPATGEKGVRVKVWSRRSMISPSYVDRKVLVYNGKTFVRLTILEEMVGRKFGEFALTRKKPKHKINKKKQVARKKKR